MHRTLYSKCKARGRRDFHADLAISMLVVISYKVLNSVDYQFVGPVGQVHDCIPLFPALLSALMVTIDFRCNCVLDILHFAIHHI